jgi:sulfite exporter TauE/SafE
LIPSLFPFLIPPACTSRDAGLRAADRQSRHIRVKGFAQENGAAIDPDQRDNSATTEICGMNASLQMLTALCGGFADGVGTGSLALAPLAGGLLLAGLAGSIAHCAPMCGPFVLGQVGDRLAGIPASGLCQRHRVSAGLLWPYHAGRIATYAGLGALVAGVSASLGLLPWFGWLSTVLLALAALLFFGQAYRRVQAWRGGTSPRAAQRSCAPSSGAPTFLGRLARRLTPRRGSASGFTLGLALGFLPCGFLYAALAVAAATANPLSGAVAMLAFGIGTVPVLLLVGIAGQAAGRLWQRRLGLIAPAVLGLNGLVLAGLAVQRLAALL